MSSKVKTDKLYWLGNAAKTKIFQELSSKADGKKSLTVFDYGCGAGGDWPAFLADHKGVKLLLYDPHEPSLKAAAKRLKGFDAHLVTEQELAEGKLKADVVVSLSVLEHVADKALYLGNIKRHLKTSGVCYLNYDDGHFRTLLDLNSPTTWLSALVTQMTNLLASVWLALGLEHRFQKRVHKDELDQLLSQCGLKTERVFYSNLLNLKQLHKTIPKGKSQDFSKLWLELEEQLNQDFLVEGERVMADQVNLWQVMVSRTVILKHA